MKNWNQDYEHTKIHQGLFLTHTFIFALQFFLNFFSLPTKISLSLSLSLSSHFFSIFLKILRKRILELSNRKMNVIYGFYAQFYPKLSFLATTPHWKDPLPRGEVKIMHIWVKKRRGGQLARWSPDFWPHPRVGGSPQWVVVTKNFVLW